ncbi:MAG: S8 family serine peptidase [Candidatus Zixiibacteriota bacterium]
MKVVTIPVLASLMAWSASLAAGELSPRQLSVLTPSLVSALSQASSTATFDLLVAPRGSRKSGEKLTLAASASRSLGERHARVGVLLHDEAVHTQSRLTAAIASLPGHATLISSFWITNALHVRADLPALLTLAERDDVAAISLNPAVELMRPVSVTDATAAAVGAQENLAVVGARALWSRGLTGRGRLVASIDTGVEGSHPALKDRWRGMHGDTAAAWFDPFHTPVPADNNGHGTHVMGIAVGRDGADTIGMAPDAEWINAAVIDRGRSLSATFADILAALEWVADPDGDPATTADVPDVVCNSWGVSQQIINACDSLFFDAIDHVEAMGIVCVFAAGNEGPYSMSLRNPADRAVSPTSCFSIGAVDATTPVLTVPPFSSRGPSACDGVSVKPELVAPGVNIRSAYKGQSYKLISGTSMSAPHLAGAVALLRQYNPDLTPEEIKTALMATARDVDPVGEDNASGHGMLDLGAALAALPAAVAPTIIVATVAPDATGDQILARGETGPLVVSLVATGAEAAHVQARLCSMTPGVMLPVDTARFDTLPVGLTVDNAYAPFIVSVPAGMRAGDSIRFELSLTGDPHLGNWVDTFAVPCGLPAGSVIEHVGDGTMGMSLSNIGQLGLGPGSSLDAGGSGWRAQHFSGNLLYEAALMVASESGGFADASRRSDGGSPFDFSPVTGSQGVAAASTSTLQFDDSRAAWPVGVLVSPSAEYCRDSSGAECVTVTWTIHNRTAAVIQGLQIGWLLDIDIPGVGGAIDERVHHDPASGGVYHGTDNSEAVAGLTPINAAFSARRFLANPYGGKLALTEAVKRGDMAPGSSEAPTTAGDYLAALATAPVTVNAGESLVVAVAFIVAPNTESFTEASGTARDRWLRTSGIGDNGGDIEPPPSFALGHNYPNPFNAQTTIPVTIAGSGEESVRLEIVDVLGRHVTTLVDGVLPSGRHLLNWDGGSGQGRALASGIYFARLTMAGRPAEIRTLVLLK